MRLFSLICTLLSFPLWGEANPRKTETPLQSCEHRSYWDPEAKKLYIPSSMPFQLQLLAPQHNESSRMLDTTTSDATQALYFAEGEHTLAIPATTKQVYRFTADANPPITRMTLAKVPRVEKAGRVYFGPNFAIQLQAEDTVSGVERIVYSVGGEFFRLWQQKDMHFPLDGSYSLKYLACDQVGNQEPMHRFDFHIDRTPPISSFRIKNYSNSRVIGPRHNISLRAEDKGIGVAAIHYQIDDNPWQVYQSELSFAALEPGLHTFQYYAVDELGNKEEVKTWEFQYDPHPPVVRFEFDGSTWSQQGITHLSPKARLSIHTKDAESAIIRTEAWIGKRKLGPQGPYTFSDEVGHQQLTVKTYDQAHNETIQELKLFVDVSPPIVGYEVIGPHFRTENAIKSVAPTRLKLQAHDEESGLESLTICIAESPCRSVEGELEFNEPGVHKAKILAKNRTGLEAKPLELTLLVEAPRRASLATEKRQEQATWVDHREAGAIGHAQAGFAIEIADGPVASAQRFRVIIPSDGLRASTTPGMRSRSLKVAIAGHEATVQLPLDSHPPKSRTEWSGATRAERDGQIYYGPGLRFQLSATDDTGPEVSGLHQQYLRINEGSFQQDRGEAHVFSSEQVYNLAYYASDRVGNTEEVQTASFTVDLTPPISQVTLVEPYHQNFLAKTGSLKLSASDALSGVKSIYYAFNQADFTLYEPKTFVEALRSLAAGSHQLKYYAVDQVNNRESIRTYNFVIDVQAPHIAFEIQGSSQFEGKSVSVAPGSRIALLASDTQAGVDRIHYRLQDDQEQVYQGPIPTTNGMRIAVRAVDQLGNASEVVQYTVGIDQNPPDSYLEFEGSHYVIEDRIFVRPDTKVHIKAKDQHSSVARIDFRINGDEFREFKEPLTFGQIGESNFSFYAVDAVGNRETTHNYRVIVDTEKPQIVLKTSDGRMLTDQTTISKGSYLYIQAFDNQAGIKNVYYQLNQGEPILYRQPIRIEGDGLIQIDASAVDWMGEKENRQATYRIE